MTQEGESGENRGGEGRVQRFYLQEMAGGSVEGMRVDERVEMELRSGLRHGRGVTMS